MFILICLMEVIRFILIKKNITNKLGITILALIIISFEIVINLNVSTLNNTYKIFLFICTIALPIIANNLLCTYITYYYGFLPSVVYKLLINLYVYLIPIFPDLGNYLYGVISITIPVTIYFALYTSRNFKFKDKTKVNKTNISLIFIPLTVLCLIVISLVSGLVRFQIIAIASNSMSPIFERGDTIIFDKSNTEDIKIGDIIVVKKDSNLLVHRVVKIKEISDIRYYYTKGDSNKTKDSDPATEKDILGIVKYRIKYIGYPTIWVNELMKGGNK